jgi:aryl-alcohol dehydrogenase-like predicted oxidoreductase
MNSSFTRIDLAPGYSISRVIKGGWQLAGGHGAIDEKQAVEDMRSFVEAGVTTFDCADIYTGVEVLIGKFMKKYNSAFKSGTLPPVQIHTKYVPDLNQLPTLRKSYTEAVIDRSLKRLNVDRLDLVQFHWWDYSIKRYVEVAQHLLELKNAGKIAHIGVTNFDAQHLKEILDAGIKVISNQVQYSIIDNRPEKNLLALCREYDISLLCYGTLAGGFFNERYLQSEEIKEPLENRSLTKYKLIIDDFGGFNLFQDLLQNLKSIAEKYNVGIAEVAIKFIMQKPYAAGVIVGARSEKHLEKLKKLESFKLDDDDLNIISRVLARSKELKGPVYALERNRNGKHGKIMKYNLNQL